MSTPTTKPGKCRGCKAAIVWVELNGRWHPCEPRKLSIVASIEGSNKVVTGFESHFATCPDASKFRKTKDHGIEKEEDRSEEKVDHDKARRSSPE